MCKREVEEVQEKKREIVIDGGFAGVDRALLFRRLAGIWKLVFSRAKYELKKKKKKEDSCLFQRNRIMGK